MKKQVSEQDDLSPLLRSTAMVMFLLLLLVLLVGATVLTFRYFRILAEDRKAPPSSSKQVEFQQFNDEEKVQENKSVEQPAKEDNKIV
ncbi:MAG: hypothetical protein ACKO96_01145 [Flammeovirgaceae bacterium]